MAQPATFTDAVLADYAPWANDDGTKYLGALATMFESVFGLVMDQGDPDQPATYVPGWAALLDPDSCPTDLLPFLAQFVGAAVQPGTADADARNAIKNHNGSTRGTVAHMLMDAKDNLTGTQFAQLIERTAANGTPDPYHMVLLFHTSECPSVPLLVAAVEDHKPAGLQISYVATTGYVWVQAVHKWGQDTMTWAQTAFQQP